MVIEWAYGLDLVNAEGGSDGCGGDTLVTVNMTTAMPVARKHR